MAARLALFDWDSPREERRQVIYVGTGQTHQPQKPRLKIGHKFAIVFALLAMSRAAEAQEREVQTPIDMFDPESGEGFKLGPALDLHAQATASLVFDDNIYSLAQDKRDDIIAVLKPRLAIVTNRTRHYFRLVADGEIRRYNDIKDENSEQYGIAANGILNLGSRIEVTPEGRFARRIEQRGTVGDQFLSDSPIVFHEKSAGLGIARTGGRLEARARGSIYKADYRDTRRDSVPVDLSGRDVLMRRASFRTSYRVSEAARIFAEVNGNQVRYDTNPGTSRDSSGYAAIGGVQFDVNSLVEAEAGLGYIHQNFDNPAIKTVKGVNYWLKARWTPTPFWLVSASAEKQIDRSPRGDTPAIVRSEFNAGVQRALGDRLLLGAEAGLVKENYWNQQRKDTRYFANVNAHYRLTPAIGLVGSAGYRERDVKSGDNDSYKGFAAMVGVNAQW